MEVTYLEQAYLLCMCGTQVCSRTCPVCWSPLWTNDACIQQLWAEHVGVGRHAYDHRPTPERPMVRLYRDMNQTVFVRDDGTDNMEAI